MSLSSTTTRVSYAGNSSTTAFPITFSFWDDDDLSVISTNDTTGVQTTWVKGADYTVTGGSGSTGTLTATTAPATGTTLAIISALANTQPTSFPAGGAFPSTSAEQQFDQTVRQIQQSAKLLARALVQPDGDSADIARLPAKVTRASKFLSFDSNGDPLAAAGTSANLGPVSTFINTLLDDSDAATARATLAIPSTDNAFTANQTITSTDAGATVGPIITLDRNSASPAVSDILGEVLFRMRSSTGVTRDAAAIVAAILDPVNATEDAQVLLKTIVAGALTTIATWGPGLQIGAPSGGDKGAGTVNIQTGLYLAGSLLVPKQMLVLGASGFGSGTFFLGVVGNATEANIQFPSSIAGTIKNLYVHVNPAPGGSDTIVVQGRKGGSAQALTTTVTGAAVSNNDTTHSFTVAAGDLLSFSVVGSGGVGTTFVKVSIEIDPS